MTERDDRLYLVHTQECIARIELYTAEGKMAFMADTRTQDAVLRNLHTLAESSQRISDTLKATQPDMDWRAIAALRNVVVHDYLGIDLNQIWDIVQNDLPGLKRAIAAMLRELG
jgi:uncharacterized protein with HEPN domain